MVKVIGIEHRQYTSKTGSIVKGSNVYYIYPPAGKQAEHTEGSLSSSVWVSEEMLEVMKHDGFGIGSTGNFQYDKKGKFFHLSGFTFVDEENGEVK